MKDILIVDDSLLMRNIIKNNLSKEFRISGEAKNGIEAVDMAKKLQPDIITMDITMNGKNGLEAAKEILSFKPDTSIVMISALNEQNMLSEAIKAGVKEFIVKPFTPAQLEESIKKVASKM